MTERVLSCPEAFSVQTRLRLSLSGSVPKKFRPSMAPIWSSSRNRGGTKDAFPSFIMFRSGIPFGYSLAGYLRKKRWHIGAILIFV